MKNVILVLLFMIVNIYGDVNTTKRAMNEYKKGNINEAIKLLKESCDSKEVNACINLGYIYVRGLSIKKDYSKGFTLLKKACDSGSSKGCVVLGNSMIEEEGNLWYNFQKSKNPTVEDKKQHSKRLGVAMGYLKKACEKGSVVGCNSLGGAYWNNIQQNGGIKKFPKLAKKAFWALTKACDLGDIRSCMQLGYTYENIDEKYFTKASNLYKKACDLGYKKACNDYKRLHGAGY